MNPSDLVVVGKGKNRKFMPRSRANEMMMDLTRVAFTPARQLYGRNSIYSGNRSGKTQVMIHSPASNSQGAMAILPTVLVT